MMDWSGAHSFVLSATFGGGGRGAVADNPFDICKECVDWPEGAAGTLDEFVFKRLAASYSQHHPRMMRFGSSCSKERDILLGGGMRHLGNHWGRTGGSDGDKDGSMVDWSFHQMGTFELAVQVSCVKFPDDTDLASYWLDNHNSLLSFISQVHVSSISGVVTSKSGVPVPSPFVSVSGTAKAVNGTVRGDFRRLLVPGTYEVTVSGADFVPQTVRNVTVAPAGSQPSYPPPTHLNVTLWRPSEVVAQRTAVQRISRGYDAGGGYYGSGYDRGGSGGGNVGGGGDEVEESRRPRRHVGLGAAGDVPDDGQSSSWIDREDFGIVENNVDRPERYLSRSQVIAAMSELEDRFSGVVEFLDGESDWSSPLRAIRLSASGKSHKRRLANVVRVALLSFHPMATDNLIRLARHLVVGNAGEDPASQRILRRADVYLVPVGYRVDDVPPSLAHSSTRCGRENVPATETLAFNPRTTEADPKISAIVHWLRAERMDVVFTIDGGGNFVRLATDVSPEHPDMQAEFLGVRLKTATALTASDVDYNRPCFREDAVDSLLTPIPGPSSGFPVFFTAHPYKYKDTLVDYITTALRTPSLDVRFACCEGETPSTAWRRTLPVLKSLLVGTTFHATGTVRILGGEPLRRGKFVLQGAEKRNINLDDEAGRYLVMLPPGPYVALISTEGHEPEPVRFSVLQHVDPVSQDLQLTKMRHTNWFRRWTNTSLNQVGSEGERPGLGADHNITTVNNNSSSSSISSPSSNSNGHNDIVSIMGDNHNPLGMSAGKVMGVNHGLDRSFVGSGMESHFNGRHQHHNGDPVMHAANVTGHNTNNHLNLMFNGNNLMGGDQGEGGHLLMHNPFGDLTGNRMNKNNTRDQHVPKGALEEGTNSGSGEMFTTGMSDFGKDGSAHSGIEHSDAPATLMPTTTASFLKKMPRGQVGEEQYHDIAEMEKYLADIARAFPHVVKLHIIGQSVQGRNLFMVEISQDVWMPLPGRPSVAIFAGFHGNHHSGPELVLDFVDDIIQHLNGTRVQKVLKRLRIFAMPVVNPDAYGGGKPESSRFCDRLGGDWTNKNGVDLSLDYSGEIGEVETEALKRFFDAQPLTASVLYEGNLHEGVIAYPWFDKDAEPSGSVETPDSESFRWLTSAYKHKLDDEELSEYFQGTFNVLCPPLPEDVLDKGYAPAAAIAPQQGSVQDYLYKKYGALQLTVYLGCCGAPSYGAHMALWRKHRPALFHFLTTTTRHGIKGFVTKASTNEAIRGAVVSVETGDTRWTSTSRDQGQFFRLVAPNVTSAKVFVSADGFFPARKEFFLLEDELTAMKAALDEIKLPPVSMPQLPPQQPAAAVPANGPAPSPPMMITASPPVVTMRDFAANNNNNVNSGGDSASTASSSMMSTVTTAQPSSSTAGDGQNRPARKIDGLATFRRKRADRK